MKLRKVESFRREKVAESISTYLGVESKQLEILGQFSNGAINDHFLFSCSNGDPGVWRERNALALPVDCQNLLKLEAQLIAGLSKQERAWCPALVASIEQHYGEGFILEAINGDSHPKQFYDELENRAFWYQTAQIMAELHDTSLPVEMQEALAPCSLSYVLSSFAEWVEEQAHPMSETIAKELEFIVDDLARAKAASVLCHNDFRMGNLLRSKSGQIFLLDWEFAGLGEREQDIGWLFAPCWRYAKPEAIEENLSVFIESYQELSSIQINEERVGFWRYASQVRWSAIALMQEWRLKQQGLEPDYSEVPQQSPENAIAEARRLKALVF